MFMLLRSCSQHSTFKAHAELFHDGLGISLTTASNRFTIPFVLPAPAQYRAQIAQICCDGYEVLPRQEITVVPLATRAVDAKNAATA